MKQCYALAQPFHCSALDGASASVLSGERATLGKEHAAAYGVRAAIPAGLPSNRPRQVEPGRRLSGSDAIFQHAPAALLDLTGFVRQDMAVRGQLPNPAAHFLKGRVWLKFTKIL